MQRGLIRRMLCFVSGGHEKLKFCVWRHSHGARDFDASWWDGACAEYCSKCDTFERERGVFGARYQGDRFIPAPKDCLSYEACADFSIWLTREEIHKHINGNPYHI